MTVRYAARLPQDQRSHELEATSAEIWSEAITAIYDTDPEIIASLLPKPLEPGPQPRVRITITNVTADAVGPTPDDLGQDVTLRTDPEMVRTARWWKEEYGVS